MANYKIVVSKYNKKYTLVLKAENELAARERVHKEGYSILTIQEIGDNENIGTAFIFEGYKNGEFKHGKITGNDVFKAYVKLKDLGYDLDYIYLEQDKDLPLEQKKKIIKDLEDSYNIVSNKKKANTSKQNTSFEAKDNVNFKNFYLNKELEETNKLIDEVLRKLDNIFSGKSSINLLPKTEQKLKSVYNEIIKLKKSTNISKLKEVGELALEKVGELELEEVKKSKNEKNLTLLKETNKLLREFGSKSQFVDKKRDIGFQLKSIINNIGEIFASKDDKKKKLDKDSYEYVKTYLYLTKYKQKYSSNTKFIIKNLFKILFSAKLREETFLRRNVIKQNITLLKAKLNGVNISYTYLKKGIFKLLESVLLFFRSALYSLFLVIFIYTITFIVYFNISLKFPMQEYSFSGVSYFLVLILLYLCIYFAKNIGTLVINFAILYFIIIFGTVNF